MQTIQRRHARANVTIPAKVATRISATAAVIRDISAGGAKIEAEGVRPNSIVTLSVSGIEIPGTVMWADPDRFGMRFDSALSPLTVARVTGRPSARPVFGRRKTA